MKTEEKLRKQIQDHPRSRIAMSYRLGLKDQKGETERALVVIDQQHSAIARLEGELHPEPAKHAILRIYWANGGVTKIELVNISPVANLVADGKFLVLPVQRQPNLGHVINLSQVLMLSQF